MLSDVIADRLWTCIHAIQAPEKRLMVVIPEQEQCLILSLHPRCCARKEHCAKNTYTSDEAADFHDGHYNIRPMNMFCTLHHRNEP